MMNKKIPLFLVLFVFVHFYAVSGPIYSETWGFSLDLPVCFEFSGGNSRDTFSFENPDGARLDLVIYHHNSSRTAIYSSVDDMARDMRQSLNNQGETDFFNYNGRRSYIMELEFFIPNVGQMSGWALGMELAEVRINNFGVMGGPEKPLLLVMAYGPAGREGLELLYVSALDSLSVMSRERFTPGPMTEYAYPRRTPIQVPVFGLDISALIYREDAEAAQALIDREFDLLRRYENADTWREAWTRFYRTIYRDSFDRLTDLAFQVERALNVPPRENRDFAGQVLNWVQSFNYERDLLGSDFLNLVSAAVEGRGDCDNRAMLWATVLRQAGIPSAMMVSRHYSHAMGLAELPGSGARFELGGQRLLVAETTARVSIGLIAEDVSGTDHWLGIVFE